MSSGFISEAELTEQRRVRQEEWDKVRKPEEPEDCPEPEFDHRSLFDRLEEQKRKRELDYEEAHKLKNMIKGLDDEEVEFLDLVDRSKLEEERRTSAEDAREIKDFRNAVASLQERHIEELINTEIRTKPALPNQSGRSSQTRLLAGAVVRKQPADVATPGSADKKSRTSAEATNGETENGGRTPRRTFAARETEAPSNKKRKLEGDEDPQANSMQCIGILPGLGTYADSSDSEQSSDTDQESVPTLAVDLLGRKIVQAVLKNKSSSGSDESSS